jgi:hypothetical protein
MNTDITGVRFSDNARWGREGDTKEDRFKILDERLLEDEINKENDRHTTKDFNLGSIKAVYRNLRENYEYRMRYDEAGQFFIREMELKRMYREAPSTSIFKQRMYKLLRLLKLRNKPDPKVAYDLKRNDRFRRNLFSLTAWYYHLSRYGEDLLRPTLAGIVIVLLSTLFWLTQSRPILEPTLNFTNISPDIANHTSTFILLKNATNHEHWLKAFERSIADFLPLLPLGDIKVGVLYSITN